jgi:5,6-dimethylbenzimidazole synthase
MKFSPEQADVLNDILRWRRDVRHFLTDPVPEPVIDRLRAAMDRAPSVGNSRPWRVLRVKDPALRQRIQAIFEGSNLDAAAELDAVTRSEYTRLKLAGLRDAPLHLAVFTETAPVEGRGLGRRTMPETLQFSTVMAIHTLWLVARAENIGVGWVSILDPAAVQALFGVPKSWEFTGYLCVGYAEFDDDRPLLHRAAWQHDTPTDWKEC